MNIEQLNEKISNINVKEQPEPKVNLKVKTLSSAQLKEMKEKANKLLNIIHNNKVSELEKRLILGQTVMENEKMIYKKMQESLEKSGLIVEDMNLALDKYDFVKDYFFELFKFDNALELFHAENWNSGVFVWAKKGVKFKLPVHAFFLVNESMFAQAPHSLIVLEEDSEVHIVEGCTAQIVVKDSLHIGATEIFLKKGSKLFITKLQNWPEYVSARPLTYAYLEENSELHLINVILGGGNTTVEKPKIYAKKNSKVYVHEIIIGKNNAIVDLGSDVYLEGENSKAELISKSIAFDNSNIITRGIINGNARKVKGHIVCDSLLFGGNSEAYPGLTASLSDLELTHEASLGKISDKELIYLQNRGFSEQEATDLIVKGFISDVMKDIPLEFRSEIERFLEFAKKSNKL